MAFWLEFSPTTIAAAIVSAAVTVAAIYGGLARWLDRIERKLETNPAYRQDKAQALLNPGPFSAYERALDVGLSKLDSWMGPPRSWQAFWCLAAALIYAVGLLLLA